MVNVLSFDGKVDVIFVDILKVCFNLYSFEIDLDVFLGMKV